MIHTTLMFLAIGQELQEPPKGRPKLAARMASRHVQHDSQASWKERAEMLLSILAESLGLILFLIGLWLLLRLAEVLLS